jgi:hypothetical protein
MFEQGDLSCKYIESIPNALGLWPMLSDKGYSDATRSHSFSNIRTFVDRWPYLWRSGEERVEKREELYRT